MAGLLAQVDIPAFSILDMPLNAPAPSTIVTRQDHIKDLHTLISFIKGIHHRTNTIPEWPWYAFYGDVLRHFSLSLPLTRGTQKRLLSLIPQGRVKRRTYRSHPNTEQWSIAADWDPDKSFVADSASVVPATNISHDSTNKAAATNDPISHIAGDPTLAAPIVHIPIMNEHDGSQIVTDSQKGDRQRFNFDVALLEDEQAFRRQLEEAIAHEEVAALSSPRQGPSSAPRQPLASDDSTPLLPLPPGNILSAALSTNISPGWVESLPSSASEMERGVSALANASAFPIESAFDDHSAEISATASSEPDHGLVSARTSRLDDEHEGLSIAEQGQSVLSISVNLGHIPRTQNRPRNPEKMVVEYEERIPDFMIFSQPKAEGTYSTVNAIPSSVGHPILIVEIKPLRLGGSLQDVIATMNHASATRQTSVQACLGLDEYKLDAITVMTAVGLYVRFEEYRREDVASFLRRAIPLEGAPPSRYARPSSSSEVMYIFNDDMSDYSPGVLERWREALQLA